MESEHEMAFDLLGLPQELLEETALWFKQHEAVKVLTVNKACHDAFARSLWRKLSIGDVHLRLPREVWLRYGPLVRVAKIRDDITMSSSVIWIPNAQSLSATIQPRIGNIFEGELRNLRKLTVFRYYNMDWYEAAVKLLEWVHSVEERGQKVQIHWQLERIQSSSTNSSKYESIKSIVDSVTNPRCHSISISLSLSEIEWFTSFPELGLMLSSLMIKSIGGMVDSEIIRLTNYFCDTSSTVRYPRLRELAINLWLQHEHPGSLLVGFVPARFPSLQRLDLAFYNTVNFDSFAEMPMFEQKWSTVTDFTFRFGEPKILELALRGLPSVKRLALFKVYFLLDLGMVIQCLEHLETFIIDGFSEMVFNEEPTPSPRVSKLREFVFNPARPHCAKVKTPVDLLRFIVSSRMARLEKVTLTSCLFKPREFQRFAGGLNNNVRTLVTCVAYYSFNETQLSRLIEFFPNLRALTLTRWLKNTQQELQARHPNIKIYCAHWSDPIHNQMKVW